MSDLTSTFLVVEESWNDIFFIRQALESMIIPQSFSHFSNGREALEYLYKSATKPLFIFVSKNLPDKNGFELLEEIRKTEELKEIPVAMFSETPLNISDFVNHLPNKYIVKPKDPKSYEQKIKDLATKWLKENTD